MTADALYILIIIQNYKCSTHLPNGSSMSRGASIEKDSVDHSASFHYSSCLLFFGLFCCDF